MLDMPKTKQERKREVNFLEMLDAPFSYRPPRRGEIRWGTVLQVGKNGVLVDVGDKRDGIVPPQDLDQLEPEVREQVKVGEVLPVYILKPRDEDDNLVVSISMGLRQYDWDKARELLETGELVEVVATGQNKGGLLVRWRKLEGFVPFSHLISIDSSLDRRDALRALRGHKLTVKVIEVNQERRRLIFSERAAQQEWRSHQKAKLMDELQVGDVVEGIVTGIRDFGVFVDIGGADGLIHVSELAWHRVEHPRDVVSVGDKIQVYVLSLDREKQRIALSRKRLLPDPWENVTERYHEGQEVEGRVTNVVDFGAFIILPDGLEGLLHLSEIGDGTLPEPYSYVRKGDVLKLRVSRLEPEKRRISFTQRPMDAEEYDEEEESPTD